MVKLSGIKNCREKRMLFLRHFCYYAVRDSGALERIVEMWYID